MLYRGSGSDLTLGSATVFVDSERGQACVGSRPAPYFLPIRRYLDWRGIWVRHRNEFRREAGVRGPQGAAACVRYRHRLTVYIFENPVHQHPVCSTRTDRTPCLQKIEWSSPGENYGRYGTIDISRYRYFGTNGIGRVRYYTLIDPICQASIGTEILLNIFPAPFYYKNPLFK